MMDYDIDSEREWDVVIDKVASDPKTISWERNTVGVWAETEDAARAIVAKNLPGWTVYSIKEATP